MAQARNVLWVVVWVGLSLALGLVILITFGAEAATEYYAAYFLEKSLSVDNIFVFAIVFSELHIPAEYQHRVLRFGIAGALVFRALLIGAGITLIGRFGWITYPFAILLLFAAWRMLFGEERERAVVQSACNVCETWVARVVRVSPVLHGGDFWRREGGRLVATPLFVALVVIETTDNPGWWVKINLRGTELRGKPFGEVRRGELTADPQPPWLHCYIEDETFNGAGDPTTLHEILNTFLEWAGG